MGGVRLGGRAIPPVVCSPPLTAYGGAGTTGESAVYRSCAGDAAGELTLIGLTDFADSDQNSAPVLSPDGTKIAFTVLGASTGYDELWVVDAIPGSTPVQLLADASNYIEHPAWLDNDTIIFVHHTGGTINGGGIYSIPAAGGSETLLLAASGGYTPRRPQANFDGTRIAYINDQDAGSAADLRCMDADGSNDASLDNTIKGYLFNDPPQFSWALTQNLIAYSDAEVARKVFVIADDGTGKTQLNANGVAAGVKADVSGLAWAPADAFVVMTADLALGNGIQPIRAEVDGSDTTVLCATTGSQGPENRNYFRTALVYANRVWWVNGTNSVNVAKVSSCAIDGSDLREDFNNTLGSGDQVADFGGGDGFYFN